MPETTPTTFPYVEEGQDVNRGRVKLGGTSAVLETPIARGARVVLIVEADVDRIAHMTYEKLLTREHHAVPANAYIVARDEVAGVLEAAARKTRELEDKLEGLQQLPFDEADETDEPLDGRRRVGGMTKAGVGMDAAERAIRDRGRTGHAYVDDDQADGAHARGGDGPTVSGSVEVLEELERLDAGEVSDRLAELSTAMRNALRAVAGPAGMTGRAQAGAKTDASAATVRTQELGRLVTVGLVREVDDDAARATGLDHALTSEGHQIHAALGATDG